MSTKKAMSPTTLIGLAWDVLSSRSITANAAMLLFVVAAAAVAVAYVLGPAGVAAVVAARGAGKGVQAVGRWRRRATSARRSA